MSVKRIIQKVASGAMAAFLAVSVISATANAVAAGDTTDVNTVVSTTISVSSLGTVALTVTPAAGGAQTSASDTVTVSTNSANGYKLMIKDADATLTLTNGAHSIAASSNSMAGATTLANNTWGFAVASTTPGVATNTFDSSYAVFSNQTSHASKWAGITAADQQIKSTNALASGDTTNVWYSIKADASKASGTYSDIVTYTATANP